MHSKFRGALWCAAVLVTGACATAVEEGTPSTRRPGVSPPRCQIDGTDTCSDGSVGAAGSAGEMGSGGASFGGAGGILGGGPGGAGGTESTDASATGGASGTTG